MSKEAIAKAAAITKALAKKDMSLSIKNPGERLSSSQVNALALSLFVSLILGPAEAADRRSSN